MDNNKEEINVFIEPIFLKKTKFHLPSKIKLMKLKKKIRHVSPDFNTMIDIYNFLIILRNIYMYTNDDKHNLFIATVPKHYDAAMIYKESNFEIKFILKKETRLIGIEITRNCNTTKDKEQIIFNEGENIITSKYDEEKFLFIISCLMNGLVDLIDYYYNNKKF